MFQMRFTHKLIRHSLSHNQYLLFSMYNCVFYVSYISLCLFYSYSVLRLCYGLVPEIKLDWIGLYLPKNQISSYAPAKGDI